MIPAAQSDTPTGATNTANAIVGALTAVDPLLGAAVGALGNNIVNVASGIVDGISNVFSDIFGW